MVKLSGKKSDDIEDGGDSIELTRQKIAPSCPTCKSTDTIVTHNRRPVRYCLCRNKDCPNPRFKIVGAKDPVKIAGVCPKNPKHIDTRIYGTGSGQNYCVCDDCGHTWKVKIEA